MEEENFRVFEELQKPSDIFKDRKLIFNYPKNYSQKSSLKISSNKASQEKGFDLQKELLVIPKPTRRSSESMDSLMNFKDTRKNSLFQPQLSNRIRNLSYEENNSQNPNNDFENKILPSNPQIIPFGAQPSKKKQSFQGNLRAKLLGISNLSNYLNSINLIERKVMQNDSNGFLPFSNLDEQEKLSIKSENTDKNPYRDTKLNFLSTKFNLLDYIINNQTQKNINKQIQKILDANENEKYVYGKRKRKRAIEKYRDKKERRKSADFIRYKIRKNLAEKRKRHKGKFVKNKKIDLKQAIQDFMKEKRLSKEMQKLSLKNDN